MKSKLLLFALLLMEVSAVAQVSMATIGQDCSQNGQVGCLGNYSNLYVLGNVVGTGWDPFAPLEMEVVGTDIFRAELSFTAETAYFAFVTEYGNWDIVNSHRWGGANNDPLVEGEAVALVQDERCVTISAGTYVITVDMAKKIAYLGEKDSVASSEQCILSVYADGCAEYNQYFCKFGQQVDVEAVAMPGYHFTQWSDGNTDNPRLVTMNQNLTYTATFAPDSFNISVAASPTSYGGVSGTGLYGYNSSARLTATANYGYKFSKWNDGNTNNPRLITVTKDETYTAYFEPNTYVINLSTLSNGGKVFGQTSGKYLDTISIEATPDYGYHFAQWNDGVTDNPRSFVLTQDTAFVAAFATYSGSCGNDIDWKYSDGILTISGYGAMYDYSSNTVPWLLFRDSITSLTISENITSIGDYAFYGLKNRAFNQLILPQTVVTIGAYAFAECNRLTNICFGQNLEEIEDYAFYNCARISEMTSYATNAPDIYQNTFAYVSHYAYLFVPCESLRAYQIAAYWNAFDIKCIGAESNVTPIDDVVVTPSENSANIVWPKDDAADTYTIDITKDGTTICTLTFNSNGQLMNIAFAPSRDGESPARVAESINGSWSFTVTSLAPATTYAYTVTTKNASQSVLYTYTGNFTTTGTTGIETVNTGVDTPTKFLRDGQILIQRGNTTYNLRGQVVK